MRTELREVQPGLCIASRIEPSGWCFNTILLEADGGLIAYSPTKRLGDELHSQIRALGPPRWLIAANHFHHLGIPEWKQRYPEAVVLARPEAIPRLSKVMGDLEIGSIGDSAIEILEPEGTKNGEVWLKARDGWIVGDAFFNVRAPVTGVTGLLLRATGTAPGLRIGRLWGPLHLADRGAYRRWLLDELARAAPTWLIPAHGDPIAESGLGERLRRLAALI